MSVIFLDQRTVHYEVLGRGRPVIFLHSWIGSWRYWVPSMQSASTLYRAYALDFWGFGDTAKFPDRYHLETQTQLLDNFLDQMGIGRIALVGHGLGAIIALLYTLQHPEIIDRLMIIGLPIQTSMINTRLRSETLQQLLDWLIKRSDISEPLRAETLKTDMQALHISLDDLTKHEIWEEWKPVDTPCLQVYGQNDPLVLLPDPDKQIPVSEHSHMIILEQSAHYPMLDEINKFNRLLMDFLALPSGESPRQLQLKEEWKRRVR